ncbi:DUF3592 domain-containing protein [Streptomyces sp. NPDC090077]|uniref:DUF3592 domain-containing protein n=1 Tax=Streptomyces sp. NPDC090077 TaxID=3365938 RepID=UPI00380C8BB9
MGWYGYLALWCGLFGLVALIGYGRSLAGVNRARRMVRVVGRIERVEEPRHGSSPSSGIPVVVSFREPSTLEEFTVTNDGERGDRITAAWTGREVGVRYPPGSPQAFRFTGSPGADVRGLGRPNFAAFLVYAGVVVVVAVDRGWPWALLGFGGPWALSGIWHLPGNVRDMNHRLATLDSMTAVPGRVVAVITSVSAADDDGHVSTRPVPVVAFGTRDGRAVTAYCGSGLPDPAGSRGRDVTIHYAPDDPADFTLDPAAERRSCKQDIAHHLLGLLVVLATTVVGAVAL